MKCMRSPSFSVFELWDGKTGQTRLAALDNVAMWHSDRRRRRRPGKDIEMDQLTVQIPRTTQKYCFCFVYCLFFVFLRSSFLMLCQQRRVTQSNIVSYRPHILPTDTSSGDY